MNQEQFKALMEIKQLLELHQLLPESPKDTVNKFLADNVTSELKKRVAYLMDDTQ